MKTLIIILAGTIGLQGCTAMDHYQAREGSTDVPYAIHSTNSAPYPPADKHMKPEKPRPPADKDVEPEDPYIRDLPKNAEAALAEGGINDIAFLAAVDHHGVVRLLRPENVKYKYHTLSNTPRVTREISITPFKGSYCVLWSDGWMNWRGPRPDGLTIGERWTS